MVNIIEDVMQILPQNQINEGDISNKKFLESVQSQIVEDRKRHQNTGIGTIAPGGIITFLWVFPNQIMEHPLLKK